MSPHRVEEPAPAARRSKTLPTLPRSNRLPSDDNRPQHAEVKNREHAHRAQQLRGHHRNEGPDDCTAEDGMTPVQPAAERGEHQDGKGEVEQHT
jgi:hypothetical protein